MTASPAKAVTVPRANVLGVGVHAISMSTAVPMLCTAVAERRKGYVCVAGVHGVMEAQRHPDLLSIFGNALLVVPDGTPTVWMGRLQGHRQMRRIFGPDLMLALISQLEGNGYSHFLYGGDYGVAEHLRRLLADKFPGANIVGTYTPPFRPLTKAEESEFINLINRCRPDVIWVGLSTPKQERFMAELSPRLHTTLMIGVGAAFDYHTGRLKDSPAWIKCCGLQWLHRLTQEPTRLWKRYLFNNPPFLAKAVLQIAGLKRYRLNEPQGCGSVASTGVTAA